MSDRTRRPFVPAMEAPPVSPSDWAEQRRRRRERHLIVASTLFLILTTALSVYLSGPGTFVSLASNALIFGLLSLNAILILLLIFLVVRNLVKLLFERKRGIFGAKLRTKFVVAFVGFSVVPAVLLFVVAISYIGTGTELWLNTQIESSLRMSRDVVEALRRQKGEEGLAFARQVGRVLAKEEPLSSKSPHVLGAALEGKRREFQLDFLAVYSARMEPLAEAFSWRFPKEGYLSSSGAIPLGPALRGEEWFRNRKTFGGEVIEAYVPLYSAYDPKDMVGVVAAGYLIPQTLSGHMEAISQTYEQYRHLRSQETPIELNYYILLTVALLAVIFLSSWFGFYLAKQITIPLQALADKTREVALGHLDFQLEEGSRDEIGTLIDSFNSMTQQLKRSQQALEASHRDLQRATVEADQRRRYMEIVLENVATGVVSLDQEDRITTVNRAAQEILGVRADRALGRRYAEVIPEEQRDLVQGLLAELKHSGKEALRKEVQLGLEDRSVPLRVQANQLRDEKGGYLGMVVVFDDLSELQRAQRMVAWKEVARRIAHEIRNPLTPIKLSAERIRKRYLPARPDEGGPLDECTRMIIDQVDHLQALVEEFQRFARMPELQRTPQDLNQLVHDVVALYRGSHPHVEIQFEAGEEMEDVPLDRDQFQRVLINLINNALAVVPEGNGRIQIRTAFNKRLRVARLEVADNGPGVPPEDKARLFEPYFSTKKSGTGLGLTIVRSIVHDHRGYIRVLDNEPRGTRFVVELPL
ncbi:MAG: sensor histidine kinase [Thermodesulfobacteriota bacterium]